MAEEDVMVAAPEAPGVQLPTDHEKKRKLGDLETEAPEPLSGIDSNSQRNNGDGVHVENADQKEDADNESELKRPRLDDSVEEPAAPAPENGFKVEENPNGEADRNINGIDQEQQVLAGQEQNDDADQTKPQTESGDGAEIEKVESESGEGKENPVGEVKEPSAGSGSDGTTTSKKMEVPNNKVGVLIGKAGDTIRFLQFNSGAKIQIMRDADADPRAPTRPVELIGTLESINKAEKLINDVIAEADAGGSPSLVARGLSSGQSVVGDQVEIQVPNEKVGLIIGKGGETIKNLQTRSGARIQLVPQHLPAGDQSKERTVRVSGDRKQIEMAKEMIKEVMTQPMRPSPLSGGGYNQPAFRPRGPVTPQWTNRGHPGQHMGGYEYQQRGPYPQQNPQYPPQYNYPQQAPRTSFGPGWEQRPAMHGPPQGNYYGQGPEYGQPGPYSQAPAPSYGPGYNEMKYDHQVPSQHPYGGPGVPPQSTGGYSQATGAHPGYGPQDQYGRPGGYGMPPQGPHSQTYGQPPRANQPGEMQYSALPSAQAYGSNVPPQQTYGYSGGMQQGYPPYAASGHADGYSHPPATTPAGPGYAQPAASQPVSGYGQPGMQQPSSYAASVGGYGSYPSQPGYTDQAAAAPNTGYGYQAPADAAYPGTTTYGAPATAQQGYAVQQPPPTQPGYDQTANAQAAYGTAPASTPAPAATPASSTPAAAPAGYVKSVSPQPGYPQYDSSQMYTAPR
ncbi:OLC1v1018488C1 [Oldenlandia corymbosa var. corymbosa]|uniref:OLC1v1018488C1 n=1 Tax=Oldenlandia corymbosa var. corymbosa TaxID=529605 RepID=A0AAV1EBV5_OLDCO|nr:OLC1v1018488C1 [Oldenlandia corymbosa var. corymbosa]